VAVVVNELGPEGASTPTTTSSYSAKASAATATEFRAAMAYFAVSAHLTGPRLQMACLRVVACLKTSTSIH
jgi:hypothetical protein